MARDASFVPLPWVAPGARQPVSVTLNGALGRGQQEVWGETAYREPGKASGVRSDPLWGPKEWLAHQEAGGLYKGTMRGDS